jgi:putative NADH-flavin reductase
VRGLKLLVVDADAPLGRRLVNEALLRGHTVLATVSDPAATFSPTVRVLTGPDEGGEVDVVLASGAAPAAGARAIVVGGAPGDGVTAVLPTVDPVPGTRTGRYGAAREGVLSLEDLAVAVLDEVDRPAHEDDVLVVGPA